MEQTLRWKAAKRSGGVGVGVVSLRIWVPLVGEIEGGGQGKASHDQLLTLRRFLGPPVSIRATGEKRGRRLSMMEDLEKLRLLRRARVEDLISRTEYDKHRAQVLQMHGFPAADMDVRAANAGTPKATRHPDAECVRQHVGGGGLQERLQHGALAGDLGW